MPTHATTQRHLLLVRRLQRFPGQPVLFEKLQRYLLEQTSVGDLRGSYSRRTFERDQRQIAELFGLTIRSRRRQGYYLAETDPLPPGHEALLEALELREFLRLPTSLAPYVQREDRQPAGLEYLRPLLRAAQAGQVVELRYQKHWDDEPASRTIGPLLLREFRGRWYVLARMESSSYLACFGLDRIRELTPTTRCVQPPAGFDPATYFAHCFGITRPTDGQQPQLIRLRFAPVQGRYVLSFPLHTSQQLVSETADAICLNLTVYDTHDLRMELLSYGPEVEVLAPAGLRRWLRQAHATAVNPG
ncbi:WYL domain-containing protein [Hymenobacter sp. NST-14]|uniref:helix-turn-helix transcriptional regulator n=1 Tax=Hymenobacter piscis TaxID=2839984 RepID=UPI001C01498F|nr:WYL domain-containing protein [Hymenobacter piscis]MBT9395519.1 WYL domain-containing protein [Hymenobacter piscis]